MSKKKILHLAKWYPNKEEPLLGIFVMKHVLATKTNFHHKVISIHQSNKIKSNILIIENENHSISETIFYYKKGSLNKIKVFLKILRELSSSNADLIHAHVMGWPSTLGFLYSKINKIPFHVTEHWTGYRKGKYALINPISKRLRSLAAKRARTIQVVSKFLKNDMIQCNINGNFKIIPNVVDGPVDSKIIKNKNFTFTFVGDLNQEHKNVAGILNAFSKLQKKNRNLHLNIVGDGESNEEYKKQSKLLELCSNIRFHGSKSNKEVFGILQKSHVLVLNSFFETFSIICAEALLCGIPVISTKCGGPETFLNDNTGIMIDIDNEAQLVDAMCEIMTNHHRYDPKLLKNVAQRFNSLSIGKKILNSYQLS